MPTVGIALDEKHPSELVDTESCDLLGSVVCATQDATLDNTVDALVQQRHGRRRSDEVGQGRQQLANKSRLQRRERRKLHNGRSVTVSFAANHIPGTHQLDQLDRHPVVAPFYQQLE